MFNSGQTHSSWRINPNFRWWTHYKNSVWCSNQHNQSCWTQFLWINHNKSLDIYRPLPFLMVKPSIFHPLKTGLCKASRHRILWGHPDAWSMEKCLGRSALGAREPGSSRPAASKSVSDRPWESDFFGTWERFLLGLGEKLGYRIYPDWDCRSILKLCKLEIW